MIEEHGIEEHGPDEICYLGGSGKPYYQPFIGCCCGWKSGRCESFEEAGARLDAHLKEEAKRE